jgi:hypothetical protein
LAGITQNRLRTFGTVAAISRHACVWIADEQKRTIARNVQLPAEEQMHEAFGYVHARGHFARRRLVARLSDPGGQGTVEYVGLILLVSLLMVGMVAAMKGFNGRSGTEIAEVIVSKIKSAVNAITFR